MRRFKKKDVFQPLAQLLIILSILMRKNNLHNIFFTAIILCLVVLVILIYDLFITSAKLENQESIRHKSFLFADELKQSSDDLTRFCRTYVVTGDSIWENRYWEVLDIRNGKKPRLNGRLISLQDSMRKLGFVDSEFDKLKEAEKNSNDLVWTEKVAFNARKGLYCDSLGNFTVKREPDVVFAQKIMFDTKYQSDKESIMNPINEFFNMLDLRTMNSVEKLKKTQADIIKLIIITIFVIAGLSFYAIFILRKQIIFQLKKLRILNKDLDQKVIKRTTELNNTVEELKLLNTELGTAKLKAEESDRLKTQFINNMSHEIRTPMNGILGFSDFLDKPETSAEKRKQYISIIRNSGTQLLRIIDDILEISRLGTEKVRVFDEELCLNNFMLEVFSVFDIKAKENKTPLYLKNGLSDKASTIFTDRAKLNKILGNLLENALKYTNEGYIEIGYQYKNNELEIYVKDTGIGIHKDKQEMIFGRFAQEEKELTENRGGLGLGLAIAKENTELLGGKIALDSEKGRGSTFYVTIPYKPVIDDLEIKEKTELENPDQKGYIILIVEDEEVNYLLLEALINDGLKSNFKILHAKNGKEAVEICKANNTICCILMDLKMPVMNGFEATRRIKEINPVLPIVAQTSYKGFEEKEKALSVGCDDFITKPINGNEFHKVLDKYLDLVVD